MLIMLLAAQLSAPAPTPQLWLRIEDYPAQYVQEGRTFEVYLRATVRADGTAQGCAIEKSSGEIAFDKYNCGLLLKRARFKPASDASGQPMVGVFRQRVAWVLDGKPKPDSGDIELTVAKLPSGLKSPTLIAIALEVDRDGQPGDCASGKPDQNSALVKAACGQLARSYRAIPARLNGEAVPSVQSATAVFLSR